MLNPAKKKKRLCKLMIIHRGPFVGVLSFEWYMITEYPQTWPMFPEETKHILILAPTDCKISRLAWTEKNVLPLVNSAKRYSEGFAAYCNNFCSCIYIYIYIYIYINIYIYIIYKTSFNATVNCFLCLPRVFPLARSLHASVALWSILH